MWMLLPFSKIQQVKKETSIMSACQNLLASSLNEFITDDSDGNTQKTYR